MSKTSAHGPRPVTLMSALSFNAEDLAANREGRLGRHQLFGARFYAATWSGMGLIFLVAMGVALWAQLNRDDHTAVDIIAVFVFAIVISGFCFTLAFWKLRAFAPRQAIRCWTGQVRAHEKASHWYVGDNVFRGPGASGGQSSRNAMSMLLKGQPLCDVYVLENGTAVSIERLDGG